MSIHGDNFVAISWAATLPGYRKLGIAGYLIQEAEREGIKHGKKFGALGAYPGAIGAYKRAGYREYCHTILLELKENIPE
jgi:GNAT superfamily N-acetyltransferase